MAIAFRNIQPRDVPPIKAARRMGLTESEFENCVNELIVRGFPKPDRTTGYYDLQAIDAWMSARHPQLLSTHTEKTRCSVHLETLAKLEEMRRK